MTSPLQTTLLIGGLAAGGYVLYRSGRGSSPSDLWDDLNGALDRLFDSEVASSQASSAAASPKAPIAAERDGVRVTTQPASASSASAGTARDIIASQPAAIVSAVANALNAVFVGGDIDRQQFEAAGGGTAASNVTLAARERELREYFTSPAGRAVIAAEKTTPGAQPATLAIRQAGLDPKDFADLIR